MEAHLWVTSDKNVPQKLKCKFYRVVVRPTMLYGVERPLELLFLGKDRHEVTRLKGEGTTTMLHPKTIRSPSE